MNSVDMPKNMKIAIILFFLTTLSKGAWVFPVGAYAALEQPVFTNGSDEPYGQTFTLTEDITIIGIELIVRGWSSGVAFTLELHRYEAESVSVDSSILGSGQAVLGDISLTQFMWTPVVLDRAVEGKAGEMFAFTQRSVPTDGSFNMYGVSRFDPYAGGSRFGSYGFGESGLDPIALNAAYDYAFRIIAIPEPGTVLLSAVGLGCLLGRRRRFHV